MTEKPKKPESDDISIGLQRKKRQNRIYRLHDYKQGYNIEIFTKDLIKYFDGEVDFNLKKIHQHIEEPGKLGEYVEKARTKNTHPVTEFIQDLFKDLGASGKEKWPEELERGKLGPDD